MQDIQFRFMNVHDISGCDLLRQAVGWNQTYLDWQRFLSYDPEGCIVAVHEKSIVGSACTITYEKKFGWVAMVIVDPEMRRLGIGKTLLKSAITHLQEKGVTVKLDATPEGKLLYDTLGFKDEYGAARMECKKLNQLIQTESCQEIHQEDLDEVVEFDSEIFGACRRPVLESYYYYYPRNCFLSRKSGKVTGYIMAREGTHAFHPGPWLAQDDDTAYSLLSVLLARRKPERVFIDIIEPNQNIRSMLQSAGFRQQRPFIRMFLGKNLHPGKPQHVYGMSGPELG